MIDVEINIERDQELMQILGTGKISYLVAHTDKGELTLVLNSGSDDYRFELNGIPADDDLNDQLMKFYQ
jgi:hypothetical protein